MKHIKSCLFIMMLAGVGYSNLASMGDVNGDGSWNVLDIVTLSNCVLATTCEG